jgi:hypothetical protein
MCPSYSLVFCRQVEEWEVEQDRQDREQGLDRVPTRLSTDQPRAVACSSNSIPERDGHGLVPQPGTLVPSNLAQSITSASFMVSVIWFAPLGT